MYKDYLDAILRYYEQQRTKPGFPPRLLNPTPSKLREECAFVYQTRFEGKDLPMLRTFFSVPENADIAKAIDRFDIDKFRPLVNYLKKATDNTEDKNIELLGWLLDFDKRPYNADIKYDSDDIAFGTSGSIMPIMHTENGGGERTNESVSSASGLLSKWKNLMQKGHGWILRKRLPLRAGSVTVLFALTAFYFINKENVFGNGITGTNECMIWTGDQYEKVSCDTPRLAGLPIPLDKARMNNLQRITLPDTVTEKYIGNLWYRKRGGDSIDLYTAGGRDPVDLNQDLKRLTPYIYDKYLRKDISVR